MSFTASSALVGFQLVLLIFFVHSQLINTTSEAPKGPVRNFVPYVVGASPTGDGEYLSMAALGWKDDSEEGTGFKFYGGGMLISTHFVLTAAHNVYQNVKPPDIVFIGGKNLSEVQSPKLQKYSVVSVTIFPQYDPEQAYHDIALIEINASAVYPAICLWDRPNLNSNNVTAIGYGLTEFAGTGSQQLLKVNLTVYPAEICEPFLQRQKRFQSGISNTQICAGDKHERKDTCHGDSGGPLITRHNGYQYAIGITSYGQSCSGYPPGIYTKIYPYIEWISRVLTDKGKIFQNC